MATASRRRVLWGALGGLIGLAGCTGVLGGDGGSGGDRDSGTSWMEVFEVQIQIHDNDPAENGKYGVSFETRNKHDSVVVERVVWYVIARSEDKTEIFDETARATDVTPGLRNEWFFELPKEEAERVESVDYGAEEMELG